jgi:hypothetical protein
MDEVARLDWLRGRRVSVAGTRGVAAGIEGVEHHLVLAHVQGLVLAVPDASRWSTTSTLPGRDHSHHLDGHVLPLAAPPLGREVEYNGAAARLPGEEPADRLVGDARPNQTSRASASGARRVKESLRGAGVTSEGPARDALLRRSPPLARSRAPRPSP